MAIGVAVSADPIRNWTEVSIIWRDGHNDDYTVIYNLNLDLTTNLTLNANLTTLANFLTYLDVASNAIMFKVTVRAAQSFDVTGQKATPVSAPKSDVSEVALIEMSRANPTSPYRTLSLDVPIPAPVQELVDLSNVATATIAPTTAKGKALQVLIGNSAAINMNSLVAALNSLIINRWSAGDGKFYGSYVVDGSASVEATLPAVIGEG